MLCKRLALLTVMAGLTFSLGCSTMSPCSTSGRPRLLNRLCGRCKATRTAEVVPVTDVSGLGAAPCCDGPALMDRGDHGMVPNMILNGDGGCGTPSSPCDPLGTAGPIMTAPPAVGTMPGMPGIPTTPPVPTMPPAQGRLTPTPQAQPMPFTP